MSAHFRSGCRGRHAGLPSSGKSWGSLSLRRTATCELSGTGRDDCRCGGNIRSAMEYPPLDGHVRRHRARCAGVCDRLDAPPKSYRSGLFFRRSGVLLAKGRARTGLHAKAGYCDRRSYHRELVPSARVAVTRGIRHWIGQRLIHELARAAATDVGARALFNRVEPRVSFRAKRRIQNCGAFALFGMLRGFAPRKEDATWSESE